MDAALTVIVTLACTKDGFVVMCEPNQVHSVPLGIVGVYLLASFQVVKGH